MKCRGCGEDNNGEFRSDVGAMHFKCEIERLQGLYDESSSIIDGLDKELETFKRFAKFIQDGWDCDSDSHKYGTPCRCCEAERVLG